MALTWRCLELFSIPTFLTIRETAYCVFGLICNFWLSGVGFPLSMFLTSVGAMLLAALGAIAIIHLRDEDEVARHQIKSSMANVSSHTEPSDMAARGHPSRVATRSTTMRFRTSSH